MSFTHVCLHVSTVEMSSRTSAVPLAHFPECSTIACPLHLHVPSPNLPSAHEPWPEQGVTEPPAHSTEQLLDAKPESHVQLPSLLAPSVHVPCDEHVVAPPSQATEQLVEAKPESHVHVPSPDAPPEHTPWPEQGARAPPGHSPAQSAPK